MLARTRLFTFAWLLATLSLTSCSGSATPQLIGAFPRDAIVIATYVPPPGSALVSYDAYLDLRVYDVGASAAQAEALAYEHGGYVSQFQSWFGGDRLHVTLSLAVPLPNYESLHNSLLRLGTLENERVSGSLSDYGDSSPWGRYSTITVNFAPVEGAWRLPALPSLGWSPLATFRAAFAVFAGIFTFLIDIAIWLAVVIGPFVMLGLGLRALVRRRRPRS